MLVLLGCYASVTLAIKKDARRGKFYATI